MRVPGWTTPFDLALAVALLGGGLLELDGEVALGLVTTAGWSLPLAARRRWPLLVTLLIGAAFVASAVQDDPPEPLTQLLALLIAPYSLAAYAPLREAIGGGVGLLALALAEVELIGDGDHLFVTALLSVAWTAGRLLGTGRRREHALAAERDAAVAAERERIARELHDVVAHGVTTMVMQAGAAGELLDRDPERARQALAHVQDAGREAVGDLERMLRLLRSAPDEGPQPGVGDIRGLVTASPADVDAHIEVDVELPAALGVTAYRIVQEALTNAARHGAGPVTLRVARDAGALVVDVANPVGTDATPGTGHGLLGMRERVALYGGELRAGREDGAFRVHAILPLP